MKSYASIRSPIINRPAAVCLPARLGWIVVATFFWTCWLTCWAPLLTLTIWELSLYQLHRSLLSTQNLSHLQHVIAPYGLILLIQFAAVLAWSTKEHLCYGRLQRRQQTIAVDVTELAHFGQVPVQGLGYWQKARSITAEHDDLGRLRNARKKLSRGSRHRYQGAAVVMAQAQLSAANTIDAPSIEPVLGQSKLNKTRAFA